jgi:ADP-dependent NAD(P)H-hydrate dehydratase
MSRVRALTRAELDRHPLPRLDGGDKDSHGRVLVIAGSRDVPGAALLAAHGAMRAGAGKLQLAAPADIAVRLGIAMPEAMVVGFPTASDGGFARRVVKALAARAAEADAIVAGPGMTANAATQRLAAELCALGRPLALDAALLHVLPQKKEEARSASGLPLLLPHSGEMASLLGCAAEEVEADPLGCGRACAATYDSLVLVKGATSHVVAPDGHAWRYGGGAPGLGVSGSGDVLAGIAGGLLARGAEPLTALLWAVWLHGEAGRALSKKVGPAGFLAREIPAEIPALLPR